MQERPHTWDQNCQGLLNATGQRDREAVSGIKTHTELSLICYILFLTKRKL